MLYEGFINADGIWRGARYFRTEQDPRAKLSSNFMDNFLEVYVQLYFTDDGGVLINLAGTQLTKHLSHGQYRGYCECFNLFPLLVYILYN